MQTAISRGLLSVLVSIPLVSACSGGSSTSASTSGASQCSGASCGIQGAPTSAAIQPLCPTEASIAQNTYLGGAGSGEIVSLKIDPTSMSYTLKWLESPIPLTAGQVTPTRAGATITGAVTHRTDLPSAEQNRCAFVLQPGNGTASDGSAYATTGSFNASNPPTIFVGYGVAGGGIPGAEVQYPGILGLFSVPDRKFDFYPFIGFADVDTNLADLKGTYNGLVYHLQPSDNYRAVGTNTTETFDATGNCTSSAGSCTTTGGTWAAASAGSYFTSSNPPRIVGGATLGSGAHANMVLARFNGALVPIVVRTGYANPGTLTVDDESGIAMLAAAGNIASGTLDGGFVGADSNFKYTATLIQGTSGKFVDPPTSTAESTFTLDYPSSNQGLLSVQDSAGNAGFAIATGFSPSSTVGGLFAILLQGTENGGIAASSSIVGQTTSSTPYFGIGAFAGAH
ncbi:MAG TPA: DUF2957 domain-containing protein [Trinickia sp.]|uniref:DUF2957 domain-containing protein n=1 Tax=Trinickia sp. TaxID=2571163 RepID=UPI002F41E897